MVDGLACVHMGGNDDWDGLMGHAGQRCSFMCQ
eukprot:CAMPEP_0118953774 /NCGR_PEP_ID=MMETSP1169-20130426/57160_1 /TAXON_ID=36882 /ORGANISM="Pyramimonas obovata, Strain CCMP722" /LENGTH=32 /DNA_ID= /DNA_START= /DNA_END= /DNA_ORIENTATION=